MRVLVRIPLLALLAAVCGALTASASISTAVLHSTFAERNTRRGRVEYVWNGPAGTAVLGSGGDARFQLRAGGRRYTLYFPGANRNCELRGDDSERVPARYYTASNRTGVLRPQFRRVRCRGVYPGIDVVFKTAGASLEYDFEVAPNADPTIIRIACRGVRVRLKEDGSIAIGELAAVQKPPEVRQTVNGVITPVRSRYFMVGGGVAGMAIDKYDASHPLVIDPVLNLTATLDGPGFEAAYAMAVDASGAIYVAGETDSSAFFNAGRRSSRDAFVAKLNPSGVGLAYVTYFGGTGAEAARGIAIDGAGNAYVAGTTTSLDFPSTPGVVGASNAGFEDAFAVKLGPDGQIVYATMLGSSGSDQGLAIAIDALGSAYVAGQTSASFPTTSGALQNAFHGSTDCFVAKLSPTAGSLVYSTLLGGGATDVCRGIAVDSAGNAYVAGLTYSSDFPVQSALQSRMRGSADAFVAKLNATGSALLYSTFLGGDGFDEANAIAVDASGSAFVAGDTASWNFPVSFGAAQSVPAGGYDAFAVKLSPSGDALRYSTLIGGSGADAALAIAVDASGRALVGGFTMSLDLPVRQPVQAASGGQFDAFAAVVDNGGNTLLFCTYLGGLGEDRAYAAAIAPGNHVYLAGMTQSPNFPKSAVGAIAAGNSDVFVVEATYDEPVASGLNYFPLPPCRVADTRFTTYGAVFGPPYLKGASTRTFPLPSSPCNIPGNAHAYSLNITVLPRGPMLQYITIWPAGQTLPVASTLNSFDGRIVANAAIVPAGAGGGISMYVTEDTDVIIDINGYFGDPSAGLSFYALNPCRIADTRGYGSYAAPFGPPYITGQSTRTFPLAQSPCAPSATPQAYSLNVTALPRRSMLQYLIAWPAGQSVPTVSTLNSFNGQVVANAAILGVGSGGGVAMLASEDAEVLIDANGYFGVPGAAGALSFTPVSPCRVADTRRTTAIGTTASPSRSFDIVGSPCGIPPSARAYSLNITVLPAVILQFLQVWPTGQPKPSVSTLNSFNGAIVANAAIVPAGANGQIDIFASERADVIIDINGYFAP